MKNGFNIIFMGTPDFAVPALEALDRSRHRVSLVVTLPDRPKGRGRQPVAPPIAETARCLDYECLQPSCVKNDRFLEDLAALEPDFFVVVAFGHILSAPLLAVPRLGAINIHASLLPKYRGPAPIQWAIINREAQTGVTTMLMDKGMDTGDILLTARTAIRANDTAASLHDRLAPMGAQLLLQTLDQFEAGVARPQPQDHALATYAPMLKKEDGRINWSAPAEEIEAFVRGMSPWPGAFTFEGPRRLKLFKAASLSADSGLPPGTVLESFPDELRVSTGRGSLAILELQAASGKRLAVDEFLRGCQLVPGTILV